ncbi:hypothetical protein BDEG_25561 [Batrachochytrium dendrobatidis JEL423]|uniref:Uncharacterized protein n=1 Tax=Batrachochytrium dendrobatidis (strain JEL423) TaxID=403673 RepID=A0A177WPM2_BATDL|nr:hypothetical protein BDEG_25561 [Batrachochytrium dendrobatidis JEL423]
MKLSITVLSSVLAVCSVTIANPVDPSSTMSAEVSTSTASPSATPADGSDYPVFPSPDDGLERYCGPFNSDEIAAIQKIAKTRAKIDKMFSKLYNLRLEINAQKKVITEAEQRLNTLLQTPDQESNIAEAELEKHRSVLEELRAELQKLIDKVKSLTKKNKNSKELFIKNLPHESSTDDENSLQSKTIFAYDKCFDYFYYRL